VTEERREVKVMEFRSGLSVNGWGEREFLEADVGGEILEGSCREPKVLEWKVERVWGDEREVAWCFRPRWERVWIANIKFADGVRCYEVRSIEWLPVWMQEFRWDKVERLVCGHAKPEMEGQSELF
tara:strand:- start:4312 stop:4689 length:378 start_codon:yes stop_codon:yes gene_type:complete